ncbi:hypothetical protein [Enterococcus sp.]|uniref:hypothetical protein n=1 Tax=Enterococcus sp. TaxID=35783 RepID=UPI002FCA8D58
MFNYDKAMSDPDNHLFINLNSRKDDDTPENYNVDDFGNHIYDNDWVFIGYVQLGDIKRKFVASQEGFLTALDEYEPDNFLLNELEIISGKEWLGARWMEERQ